MRRICITAATALGAQGISSIMKILVTGHLGYIGCHLVDVLKQFGHQVTGCDIGLFKGCEWEPLVRPDSELILDIGDLTERDLGGHDAVCHLAAISNDPMGELNPEITLSVNRDKSIGLARIAKSAGVGRFLFSGSCSVYGAGEKLDLAEGAPLNPISSYAKSKIEAEQSIRGLADDGFTPVSLRNATAYGLSPMLRLDLVANNLLASAMAYNEVRIQSDGLPWRPLIHCRDIARAFVAFVEAPRRTVHNEVVNVGGNSENYQVRDVAGVVQQLVPSAKVTYTGEVGNDPRNYRVVFDKLNAILPDFNLEYNLARGVEELHRSMLQRGFGKSDFEGDRFVRLRTLKKRLGWMLEGALTN
jgi:nucleoside-diphosphate-sugar epimerase